MATPPRMILPETTYMVTRRTSERRFFLKPNKKINHIIHYTLAWAASKHSIQLHEYMFEFNHYHIVLTDMKGSLPAFMRDFNSMVSRAIAHHHGFNWPIWGTDSYNAVALITKEALRDAIVYTLTNPVKDRLVRSSKQWIGSNSLKYEYQHPIPIKKPKAFFSKKLPEIATLQIEAPFNNNLNDLRSTIRREVALKEQEINEEKPGVLGLALLLKQAITDSPFTKRVLFKLKPTIKAKNPWLMLEAIQRKKVFQTQYFEALRRMQNSEEKVCFPIGTYGFVNLGIVALMS